MNSFFIRAFIAVFMLLSAIPYRSASAEVKVIEAESSYVMGDNDSKVDARRIAVLEAKRKALDLAGTYVESLSAVESYRLTRDEVRSYTAGTLETEIISEQMGGTAEHPEIMVRVRCAVDPVLMISQIDRYRENEDLKEQLRITAQENNTLKKERDSLVKRLRSQQSQARIEDTKTKLDTALTREEANNDTNRIWAELVYKFEQDGTAARDFKQGELDTPIAALERAVTDNPQNLRAQYLLASLYFQKGDPDSAERMLRTAVQRHPSSPVPHMKLGRLLRAEGRHAEALREFHFVERVRPRYPPVVFFSGMTLKDLGKCGQAVQYLKRFLKDARSTKYPEMKITATAAIEECGGDRPGRQRRTRQQ